MYLKDSVFELVGVGYAGQLILLYSCMTYIIILSWALLYLVFSFSSTLPWASCNNYWNTGHMSMLAVGQLSLDVRQFSRWCGHRQKKSNPYLVQTFLLIHVL